MQPRTVAVYRLLYGSDFLSESLASIYPHCERILCCVGRALFGGRRMVSYFGHDVYVPHDIDGVTDAIRRFQAGCDPDGKVELIDNPHAAELKNQMGRMVDDLVIGRGLDCTHVMMVEADEVWHEGVLPRLMDHVAATDFDEYQAVCDLFWRSPRYVSRRRDRCTVIRRVAGLSSIGVTGHALGAADPSAGGMPVTTCHEPWMRVHNFGYASSARTVFWKHIAALSFSRDLRWDSIPREDWFEEVWRPWNWHRNRRPDLCPSAGHEDAFAPARAYPPEDLPAPMQRRIRDAPLAEWAQAERADVMEGATA